MTRRTLVKTGTALAACLATAVLAAQPIYLEGPEVAKLDWNTRSLVTADINNDGRLDLALINNDSGKIELLLQRNPDGPAESIRRTLTRKRWEPVLEDAPFQREGVLMGLFGYALAAGDLNGDGRTDLIYTGNLTPLTVRYQSKDGSWEEQWTFDNFEPEQWVSTLAVHDIDGDGRMDLGVLARNELLIFLQDKDGKLREPKRFRLAQSNGHGLQFSDIDGDGRPDILFVSGVNQYRRVAMRLQQAPGEFGPEIAFPMRTGSIGLVELGRSKPPLFATIEGKTRLVQTFSLQPGKEVPDSLADIQVRDYALGTKVSQASLYALGDFNGDERTDVAVADPAGARVLIFLQAPSGDFGEGVFYPSFSNISSIATLKQRKGGDALVVSSTREGVAGIARFTKAGRLSFPDLLPLDGEPLAVTCGDYSGSGNPGIAALVKKDREIALTRFEDKGGQWTQAHRQVLADVRRDPESLVSLRLNKDKLDDLMILTAREPTRLLVSTKDGAFQEVAVNSALRRTSLSGTDMGRVGIADIDGDGRNELLTGDTGYVRALALDDADQLVIVDQFNSRSPQATIRGPFLADINRSGTPQLVFYDDNADRLELLVRSEDGVYRSTEILDVGQFDLIGAQRISLGRKGGDALLFLGQERFWMVPLQRPGWLRNEVRPAYETDLDRVSYTDIASGDFNGDGKPELITIDGRQNLIEVLTYEEESGYTSALHFVVFNANIHFQGRGSGSLEPRELVVGDLNGDGRDDLAILVHNRVLLYTQQGEQ